MARDVSPPRGMRDFLPADKAKRERALRTIRGVYASHGFEEIETPVVEDFDRLHSGLGGDNEKLAFSVLKRGLDKDALEAAANSGDAHDLADLGLRFDLTVPLARFYASHRAELPTVFRAIQIAPVWRAERPQKGRYRQFVQCDIDIIGEGSQLAEVELITATSAVLSTLGLQGCTIRINDRRILAGILHYCGFAEERFGSALISIDKLDKIGAAGVVAELSETGPDAAAVLGGLLERIEPHLASGGVPMTTADILSVLPDGIDPDAVADLESLAAALTQLPDGVEVRFDPTLVRGMGYYTGTIFEIAHPESGSSVGGGGRYDGMIGRFLGQDVPAAGFSIGFERIVDLIDVDDAAASDSVVLVHDAVLDSADLSLSTLIGIKAELIAAGKRVRLEKKVKNLTPVLDRARDAGFGTFAFVSAETTSATDLVFKDLA
ncbi:histidyl-tRNA synthetase [Aurantimicrobium minutum]|uniref:histidine--tRNA ligase n=1 Tax=Aurantimicrobium minutum TaxID=708131 RepID=UPI0024770227|nr:histidine--tRNA ligase [Aurantimicrobium minutum]MDH6532513.1 histidyl-tRNA synthetase [Aurantimicrobium minutum]